MAMLPMKKSNFPNEISPKFEIVRNLSFQRTELMTFKLPYYHIFKGIPIILNNICLINITELFIVLYERQ